MREQVTQDGVAWLLWGAVAAGFVAIVAWFWELGPGLSRDDYALYIMHAEALVEGRSYSDTPFFTGDYHIVPRVQSPGLPLVLALTTLITGGSIGVYKVVMVAIAAAAVFLPGIYFARRHGTVMGVVVSAFLVVSWAPIAPNVETDLGFVALTWAVILLLDRGGQPSWGRLALVFLLASYAITFRFVGAALVPAIALLAFTSEEEGSQRLFAPVAVWGLGGVAVLAVGLGPMLLGQIAWSEPGFIITRLIPRADLYLRVASRFHLYPLPGDTPNDLFHMFSLVVTAVGLVAWAKSAWRQFPVLFTACYVVLLCIVWAVSGRYVMPLAPIFVFGFLNGLKLLTSAALKEVGGRADRWAYATGALVVLGALPAVMLQPRTGGYLPDHPDAREVFDLLLTEQESGTVRVVFTQPRVLGWVTGIPATVTLGAEVDLALSEYDKMEITHVITDRLELATERTGLLDEAIERHPCRFEPLLSNASFDLYAYGPPCTDGNRPEG